MACFRCPPHADGNRQADRAPTFKPKEATIKRIVIKAGFVVGLLAIFMVAAGPATAQKSSRDDHGNNGRDSQKAERAEPERIRQSPGPGDTHGRETGNQQDRHQQEYREQRSSMPDSPGDSHPQQEYRHPSSQHHDHQGDRQEQRFFAGRDRSPIDRYYADQYCRGKCPPGLIKKGNRCVPRGHAKRWTMNRPLPRDVIFYDLPREVLVHLGPPPPRHRFVRVAQDILLIAVGTGMVVDAIDDLGRTLD